jgi:hypothetical protein
MRTLLLSAFALSTALNAQTLTDQYIELTVSDTLALVTKAYVYELNVIPEEPEYDENVDWEKVMREQQERQAKALARLQKDVAGMGFTAVTFNGNEDPFSLQPGMMEEGTPPALRVTVKDKVELKRLVDGLRERKDVSGNIVNVEYETSTGTQQELLMRMFMEAQDRSRTLATLGGSKLGKLLVVRTAGDEEFTFADFMRIMEKERGNEDWMARYGVNMPQRMTFRFALTD